MVLLDAYYDPFATAETGLLTVNPARRAWFASAWAYGRSCAANEPGGFAVRVASAVDPQTASVLHGTGLQPVHTSEAAVFHEASVVLALANTEPSDER